MGTPNLNEHERQINALWEKQEKLKKEVDDEKIEDATWKTEVATRLGTKVDMLEKLIYAILTVTVLSFIAIIIQYAFDFLKK